MPTATPHTGPSSEPSTPETDGPTGPASPRDRWWWTGTYRGVLGALVVGFQVPLIRAGDATTANWLVGAVGAAAAVWGAVIVVQAYREQRSTQD